MRMSLKMENFCRAYVLSGVAKTAALEAGYSESYARCRSHELLDHVGVRLGIESLRWEMREHNSEEPVAGGSFSYDEPRWRQRYLEVLWAVASTSMEELIVDGEMVEPEPGSLAWWAIKSWKKVPDGKGGMVPQIELHNRMPALREFGKATGFNVPLAMQPTGKMGWKGPFSPFGPASMKDAFDPPGWSEMEKDAAAAAAARQAVGEPTDKDRAFGPMLPESVGEEATDKNRAFAGGSEFDRKMGDRKNGQSGMPIADRGIGELPPQSPQGRHGGRPVQGAVGAAGLTPAFPGNGVTDKNRAFGPMLQESVGVEPTDKSGAFLAGSDRGIGAMPPQGRHGGRPVQGAVGAAGLTPAFPGNGAAAPQRSRGECLSGMEAGASCSGSSFTIPELEAPATPRMPVVRTWTEHVAMLRREPVQVLEMLVVGLVNEPMWQGKLLPVSQRQAMINELLKAVPYEVAVKLVTRLEAEECVSVTRC